jgi:hypothetical protein
VPVSIAVWAATAENDPAPTDPSFRTVLATGTTTRSNSILKSKHNYSDREAFSAKTTDFRRSIAASGLPFITAAIMSATSLDGQLATSLPPLVSPTTSQGPPFTWLTEKRALLVPSNALPAQSYPHNFYGRLCETFNLGHSLPQIRTLRGNLGHYRAIRPACLG